MSIRDALERLGLPPADLHELPTSKKRFADGAHYRVEIPSTEGARCLDAVLDEADRLDVPVHHVSQGSGVFMLTDNELDQFVALAMAADVELSLFARPNAGWDASATSRAPAGGVLAASARGQDQLVAVLEDAVRAADHGVRSVLLALSRERVRRARLGLELLERSGYDVIRSEPGAAGLAVPVPASGAVRA
jgi:hypothetical protein